MTALTVAVVALGSTAMLVTRGPDAAEVDTAVPTTVEIADGEFGIRTYGAVRDGAIVEVDIEFVNNATQEVVIDLDGLTATTSTGTPVPKVAAAGDDRLRAGPVAAGTSVRGIVAFAVEDDDSLLLTFASEQLASPIADIPVRPS